jgi:hypothetical protein
MLHHAGPRQLRVGPAHDNVAALADSMPLFKKRLPLLCLALLAATAVRAEWLTLTGSPGEASSSYVQVDPTTVEVRGTHRIVDLRLSLAQERTTRDGIRFRSFRARVDVDCEARNARYVNATYFGQPDFVGAPIAVRVFEPDDLRPMNLAGAPRDLAGRTVNAACSVRAREPKGPGAPEEAEPR